MKRKFSLILFVALTISCSSKKPNVIDYDSERLCNGIKSMTQYIKNSSEIKKYFIENSSGSTELDYEIDSLVTEGIVFPFLQSEIANIIKKEEKISLEQANRRLETRFLSNPTTKLNSVCAKKNADIPQVKIEYYYYPEYALLTADISKIKYGKEYEKGYLVLAKIESSGEIKILKTSFWEE